MLQDADRGWTFDRPWIDGTERYVPQAPLRRRIIEALLHANRERWTQEIDLLANRLACLAADDAALERKLSKGVAALGLLKAIKRLPFRLHADDAGAVLEAGVRRGEWVQCAQQTPAVFRWVGSLDAKERARIHKEARKAEKTAALAAEKARKREQEEEAKRRELEEKRAQRALHGAPAQTPRRPRKEQEQPMLLSPELVPPQPRRDPVLRFVQSGSRPVSRSEIIVGARIGAHEWEEARRRLDGDPDFVRLGAKRGTRYIGWQALLDQLCDAVRDADGGDGANKAAIVSLMRERGLAVDDGIWRIGIPILLDEGRVGKSGRARGTRYRISAAQGGLRAPSLQVIGGGRPPDQSTPATSTPPNLRLVVPSARQRYVTCVPLIPLKLAAGAFSDTQALDDSECEWVALEGRARPTRGLFVAQVVGESMNRRIPNGAWCLWRSNPGGTRRGKVVLAQHRDIDDPELGGRYTVKVYESEKVPTDDGGWRHSVVRLKPDSRDPSFEPIVLEDLEDGELRIIAELVEVL